MPTTPTPQVVVVTGASGGVGRAIAHAFARRGAHIGLLARGRAGLDARRRRGRAARRRGARRADRRRRRRRRSRPPPAAVEAALRADRRLGQRRDGDRLRAASSTVEPDEFKRATEVTYLGTVYGTMAALRRMSARDRGTIVQVGSALAYRAIPLQAAYCGAKFAIRGFTDSIRTELLARPEQRPDHDGAAARRQHDPVQLVSHQAARPPAAGAADLPARDPGRGRLLGRAPPPPRAVGRLQRAAGDPRQQARAARWPTATWPAPAITGQQVDGHAGRRPTAPTTCSSPSRARPRRTASSTTRPRPAARSCGRRRTARCRRRAGRRRAQHRCGVRAAMR